MKETLSKANCYLRPFTYWSHDAHSVFFEKSKNALIMALSVKGLRVALVGWEQFCRLRRSKLTGFLFWISLYLLEFSNIVKGIFNKEMSHSNCIMSGAT